MAGTRGAARRRVPFAACVPARHACQGILPAPRAAHRSTMWQAVPNASLATVAGAAHAAVFGAPDPTIGPLLGWATRLAR